jgi:hypothetical protein
VELHRIIYAQSKSGRQIQTIATKQAESKTAKVPQEQPEQTTLSLPFRPFEEVTAHTYLFCKDHLLLLFSSHQCPAWFQVKDELATVEEAELARPGECNTGGCSSFPFYCLMVFLCEQVDRAPPRSLMVDVSLQWQAQFWSCNHCLRRNGQFVCTAWVPPRC